MNERTWLCNGSGHAGGVAVLMKAEKADDKVERQDPVECFGCDESSGTSSVCVARHRGDATIWLLVAFPRNPGRARGRATGGGIHERAREPREPMNIEQSLGD